jgi:hypothetical protein
MAVSSDPAMREAATRVQASGTLPQPLARPYAGGELMDERTFSELHSRPAQRVERRRAEPARAPRPAQSAAAPASTAALEQEIDRARNWEAVTRLSTLLARRYAAAVALLLVHRGVIQGLSAHGLPSRPDAVLFPADASSAFGEVATSGRPFRGAPRAGGLDAIVLRALGRAQAREIAILPVALGGRVVNLLYADNGSEPLGDTSAAALSVVCARIAGAYERVIREQRRVKAEA